MLLVESLQTLLTTSSQSVPILFVGVILLSYLLEDLAIVSAAGLASQELMPPSLALLAIFVGIATGDLGLYYLGKYCQHFRGIRYRALTNRHFKSIRRKLHQQAFLNLFIIRFIPGLRTVGFTLSGFFSIPLKLFMSAVILATALWTCLVFSTIYYLGTSAWVQASEYQWMLIPAAILLLFSTNKLLNHTYSRGLS
ncbi:DedA family protein [Vibrio sp. T187]|uniref:DedA family protein n=1 Tax=Vibrio TaxID=662 RepID=UPI0010C9574D|nr:MULTISPECIES: DedA family protein [Vibrio]MBW3697432.1 DedA family protein [Vibrio sp. T187]